MHSTKVKASQGRRAVAPYFDVYIYIDKLVLQELLLRKPVYRKVEEVAIFCSKNCNQKEKVNQKIDGGLTQSLL